jgi:hypothetical protein
MMHGSVDSLSAPHAASLFVASDRPRQPMRPRQPLCLRLQWQSQQRLQKCLKQPYDGRLRQRLCLFMATVVRPMWQRLCLFGNGSALDVLAVAPVTLELFPVWCTLAYSIVEEIDGLLQCLFDVRVRLAHDAVRPPALRVLGLFFSRLSSLPHRVSRD